MKTDTKRHYPAYASESRSILSTLGFSGILDFSRRSGINHATAAALLGTMSMTGGKHPTQIVRAWVAAKEAYLDRKFILNASMRKHVLDWMKRWRQRLLEASVIERESHATDKYELRRRERRKKIRRRVLEAALALPAR